MMTYELAYKLVVDSLADGLGVNDINEDSTLHELGLDSLDFAVCLMDVEKAVNGTSMSNDVRMAVNKQFAALHDKSAALTPRMIAMSIYEATSK